MGRERQARVGNENFPALADSQFLAPRQFPRQPHRRIESRYHAAVANSSGGSISNMLKTPQ